MGHTGILDTKRSKDESARREIPWLIFLFLLLLILDQAHYLWEQKEPTLVNWYWFVPDLNYPEWYAISTMRLIKASLISFSLWRYTRLGNNIWVETAAFAFFLFELKEIWDYWGFQNSFSSIPEIIGMSAIIVTSCIYYKRNKLI